MKLTSFIAFLMMMFIFSSCGNDDKSSSNSSSSQNGISVQNGHYNIQTQALEVAGTIYPPSQQYATIMNQALQQAQMHNIQPVMINGVAKLRARITFQNGYNNNNTGYNTGGLNITSVQFY